MISFSKLVKDELIKIPTEEPKVRLTAIILSLGSVQFSYEEMLLEIKSSNIALIRETLTILKKRYEGYNEQVILRESKKFKKHNKTYIIRIKNKTREILTDLELIDKNIGSMFLNFNIPKGIFKNDYTKKEFLRYLFISNGSINNPKVQKQYHLELIINNEEVLGETLNILKKYDINFRKTRRKNISALYLNKGEEIADFLRLIGSLDYMFEFENQRLLRDIRATENRLINAEIANETRKQSTVLKHLEAIEKLKKSGRFDSLKEKTKNIANLREEYQNASLNELVEIVDGSISRSNIRHHLNIILKEAEGL